VTKGESFSCRHCGRVFFASRTRTSYTPAFCSRLCRNRACAHLGGCHEHSSEARAKIAEAKRGRRNPMYGRTGGSSPVWRGGRRKKEGYVLLRAGAGYDLEHRLVLAERIGRSLRSEERAHHVNEVKTDNRPENLWLWPDDASHSYWHSMRRNGHGLDRPMPAVELAA
jgi:hypothetical protein